MRSRAGRPATALVALVALGAVVLAACGGEDDGGAARAELTGAVRTPPLEVGAVTLPNETVGGDGAPFAMQATPGGFLVVYFGFTSCPDICPTTLSDVGRAVQKLPRDRRDRVDVAMATVDPARDTGEVLTSYLETFVDGGGVALRTTDPVAQEAAQDAFRVVARRIPEGDDGYTFEHTAVTYVVDDDGTVVVEWPFGTAPAAMVDDLGILFDRADREGSG